MQRLRLPRFLFEKDSDSHVENKRALEDWAAQAQRFLAPTGSMLLYGAATAPDGWLLCDGQAVSRRTYADLFAIIGVIYGAGDGTTTFNLPDFRQKFPLGKAAAGTGNALGGTGGAIDHTHTGPSHNHSSPTGQASASGAGGTAYNNTGTPAGTVHNHSIATDGTGPTGLNNPPYLVVNFIIKF